MPDLRSLLGGGYAWSEVPSGGSISRGWGGYVQGWVYQTGVGMQEGQVYERGKVYQRYQRGQVYQRYQGGAGSLGTGI